jgi:hypothetical protein
LDSSVGSDDSNIAVLIPENTILVERHGKIGADTENNIGAIQSPSLQVHIDGRAKIRKFVTRVYLWTVKIPNSSDGSTSGPIDWANAADRLAAMNKEEETNFMMGSKRQWFGDLAVDVRRTSRLLIIVDLSTLVISGDLTNRIRPLKVGATATKVG